MGINPAVTYRGALSILGKYDRPILGKIEKALGFVILGAGGSGVAWCLNLLDPKNEAARLIGRLLDGASDRLIGTTGYRRHQIISAAHTVLVTSALFEALREIVGPRYRDLKLTSEEKVRVVASGAGAHDGPLLERLWRAEVPMPGAGLGFAENLEHRVKPHLRHAADDCVTFLSGLSEWERVSEGRRLKPEVMVPDVAARAAALYEQDYVRLAAEVPEFQMWAVLSETSAIQVSVEALRRDLCQGQSDLLLRVETILNAVIGDAASTERRATDLLLEINRAALRRPVLGAEVLSIGDNLQLPSVESVYITPTFRYAVATPDARPSDESWWQKRPLVPDAELFFASYFGSAASTYRPLVILGHPGAGKSLLTQVLAARLPASGYTSVRVPLRHVRADASVHRQVEQALEAQTHGRISWADLAEESGETSVRVIMLDGLDELMQATGVAHSRYLFEVAEYQEKENDVNRPIAAVVTSRTIVADRVQLPPGTLLVRLENFDDDQVTRWLATWNTINSQVDGFRPLRPEVALRLGDLARQPLLLFMLAIYAADTTTAGLPRELTSSAELYGRLITTFISREVDKDVSAPHGRALDRRRIARDRYWQLTVAAFSMFNRGRQYVSEPELEADLLALVNLATPQRTGFEIVLSHAISTVGKFFFVHVSGLEQQRDSAHSPPATFEFLHATFGEYLVAAQVTELLTALAKRVEAAPVDSLAFAEPPDDSMLRTLLSHQPLVSATRILIFVAEQCTAMEGLRAARISGILRELLTLARDRLRVDSAKYAPSANDAIERLAVYTVNLVALAVYVAGEAGVAVEDLAPDGADARAWWARLVRLWRASLTDESWTAVTDVLDTRLDSVGLFVCKSAPRTQGRGPALPYAAEFRLLGDLAGESQVRAGGVAWFLEQPSSQIEMAAHEALLSAFLSGDLLPNILETVVQELAQADRLTRSTLFLLTGCTVKGMAALSVGQDGSGVDREMLGTLTAAHGALGRSRYLHQLFDWMGNHPGGPPVGLIATVPDSHRLNPWPDASVYQPFRWHSQLPSHLRSTRIVDVSLTTATGSLLRRLAFDDPARQDLVDKWNRIARRVVELIRRQAT